MEKKETLQAVVMADNFNEQFKPFSSFNSPVNKFKSSHEIFFITFVYFLGSFATCQRSAYQLCLRNP